MIISALSLSQIDNFTFILKQSTKSELHCINITIYCYSRTFIHAHFCHSIVFSNTEWFHLLQQLCCFHSGICHLWKKQILLQDVKGFICTLRLYLQMLVLITKMIIKMSWDRAISVHFPHWWQNKGGHDICDLSMDELYIISRTVGKLSIN